MSSDAGEECQTVSTTPGVASSEGWSVTCRPNPYCLAAADILVEEGVCDDRSAAIAWLSEAGLVSHRSLFFRSIDRVKAAHRTGAASDTNSLDNPTAEERAFSAEHSSSHLHAGKRESFVQAVFRILFTRPPTG